MTRLVLVNNSMESKKFVLQGVINSLKSLDSLNKATGLVKVVVDYLPKTSLNSRDHFLCFQAMREAVMLLAKEGQYKLEF